jgi:hypothetical protein
MPQQDATTPTSAALGELMGASDSDAILAAEIKLQVLDTHPTREG